MEVGQKIKLVRLHRGLTQKQLGDLLNLGDGGANRIAQYEIGYRVPKPSLLKEIAKVLDVKEETFFVSDKFLPDILRTIMWYDFEHRRSFKLAETTLDASIAPIESKTIELRGNACTTWGDSIAPATVLWVNVPLFNDLMKEWLTRKQELASGTITKSERLFCFAARPTGGCFYYVPLPRVLQPSSAVFSLTNVTEYDTVKSTTIVNEKGGTGQCRKNRLKNCRRLSWT